jgi:hypothetical protein
MFGVPVPGRGAYTAQLLPLRAQKNRCIDIWVHETMLLCPAASTVALAAVKRKSLGLENMQEIPLPVLSTT